MILSTFFSQVNGAYRGTDDDAPVVGTTDYDLWLETTNRKIDEWARAKKWNSTFLLTKPTEPGTGATTATTALIGTSTNFLDYRVGDKITVSGETVRTIATITDDTHLTVTVAFTNTASAKTFTLKQIIATAVQSYSMHRRFLLPSDDATVVDTSDNDNPLLIEKPQERIDGAVYLSGRLPQLLTFKTDLESTDPLIGGELQVPGHYLPVELTTATDTIPVDDAYWLVYSVAGELAFNDLTYEDKAPDLFSKANVQWRNMSQNDRRGGSGRPRTARTSVTRIAGSST
jgi:hypothetical protein